MLSVCEIANKLGRSERYVRALSKMGGSPFVGGRADFSAVLKFLKKTNAKPTAKIAANRKKCRNPRVS